VSIVKQKNELISLLQDKEYRDAFVVASINIGVPAQIRTLRKQRQWSQEKLAEEAMMQQEGISRIEDPDRGSVNLKTLLKLAAAFNVGLIVRFVPFSEMINWKLNLSLDAMEVKSFDQEIYFKQPDEEITKAKNILEAPPQRQQSLQFSPYLAWDNKQNIKSGLEEVYHKQKNTILTGVAP
jgi:transcriptional regulator with XRE-family HTH domain